MNSKNMNNLVRMPILISSILLSTSVSAASGDIRNPSGIIGVNAFGKDLTIIDPERIIREL